MGLFLIHRINRVSVCIKMHLLIRMLLHNEQFHLRLSFDLSKKLRMKSIGTGRQVLKFLNLSTLDTKCCKIWKNSFSLQIVFTNYSYYANKSLPPSCQFCVIQLQIFQYKLLKTILLIFFNITLLNYVIFVSCF